MLRKRIPVRAVVGTLLLCGWATAVAPEAVQSNAPTVRSQELAMVADVPAGGRTAPVEPAVLPAGDGTAATALGWGAPLPTSDEFRHPGAPDPAKWQTAGECWPGHGNNGRRCGSLATVADGRLRLTGLANGDTGWLRNRTDQWYGRWEVRMRVVADGPSGHPYHPVLLTWPQSGRDPQGGEYDFAEADVLSPQVNGFIHHPTEIGVVQERYQATVDMTQWHTYALDWQPGHIIGYIDGVQWFDDTDPAAQAPEPMHGNIQLDNFFGADMQPAHMDVDWYRVYAAG